MDNGNVRAWRIERPNDKGANIFAPLSALRTENYSKRVAVALEHPNRRSLPYLRRIFTGRVADQRPRASG
jgi:hypothetical protein